MSPIEEIAAGIKSEIGETHDVILNAGCPMSPVLENTDQPDPHGNARTVRMILTGREFEKQLDRAFHLPIEMD